jgi:serine/threonine protein kinase
LGTLSPNHRFLARFLKKAGTLSPNHRFLARFFQKAMDVKCIKGKGTHGTVREHDDDLVCKKFNDYYTYFRELISVKTLPMHNNVINFTSFNIKKKCIYMKKYKYDLSRSIITDSNTKAHVQKILYQILLSIKHCISYNILHRDLKPHNILIDDNYDIVLCDFGLAKFTVHHNDNNYYTGLVQSEWYRAPELKLLSSTRSINRCEYSIEIDIWSVGIIAINILRQKITTHSIADLKDTDDPKLQDLIRRMLSEATTRINIDDALNHEYFAEFKQQDIKQQDIKQQDIKQQDIKQQDIKQQDITANRNKYIMKRQILPQHIQLRETLLASIMEWGNNNNNNNNKSCWSHKLNDIVHAVVWNMDILLSRVDKIELDPLMCVYSIYILCCWYHGMSFYKLEDVKKNVKFIQYMLSNTNCSINIMNEFKYLLLFNKLYNIDISCIKFDYSILLHKYHPLDIAVYYLKKHGLYKQEIQTKFDFRDILT